MKYGLVFRIVCGFRVLGCRALGLQGLEFLGFGGLGLRVRNITGVVYAETLEMSVFPLKEAACKQHLSVRAPNGLKIGRWVAFRHWF